MKLVTFLDQFCRHLSFDKVFLRSLLSSALNHSPPYWQLLFWLWTHQSDKNDWSSSSSHSRRTLLCGCTCTATERRWSLLRRGGWLSRSVPSPGSPLFLHMGSSWFKAFNLTTSGLLNPDPIKGSLTHSLVMLLDNGTWMMWSFGWQSKHSQSSFQLVKFSSVISYRKAVIRPQNMPKPSIGGKIGQIC